MDYKKSLSHFRAAAGKSVWETEWKANFKTHRTDRRITRPESHDRDKPKGRAEADRPGDAAQDVMNAIQRSHGENCLSIADRRRKTLV
jgi:hypothetical protein